MDPLEINLTTLERDLPGNFAQLANLFSFVLWQQQGIYLKPYQSFEAIQVFSPEQLRRGIRSLLITFETLKVDLATYLEFDTNSKVLNEKVSLICVGVPPDERPTFITELLFDDQI